MKKRMNLLNKFFGSSYIKESVTKKLDLLKEENIPYLLEEDFITLYFKDNMILIPMTEKGKKIAVCTEDFINKLKKYEDDIIEFLEENDISGLQISYIEDILDTYYNLNLKYLDRKNKILIFKPIESYSFETKLSIYNFAKIEILLKILDYEINIEEVKQLDSEKNDITPIVFPIRREIDIYSFLDNPESLKTNINLLEIIEK